MISVYPYSIMVTKDRLQVDECLIAPCLYSDDPIYMKGAVRDNEWEVVKVGTADE